MKAAKLRELTADEIAVRLDELRRDYLNFRFQHCTKQIENPMRIRHARREIARINTILTEREKAKNGKTA